MRNEPMWGKIKMPTCPYCFAEHRLNAVFCPSCGVQILSQKNAANQPSKKCPQCGTTNREIANMCMNCGKSFFEPSEAPKNTRQKTEQKTQETPRKSEPKIRPIDVAIIKKLDITHHYLTTIESGKLNTLSRQEVIQLAQKIFGSAITQSTMKTAYRKFAREFHPDNNKDSLTPLIDERIFGIGTLVKDEFIARQK